MLSYTIVSAKNTLKCFVRTDLHDSRLDGLFYGESKTFYMFLHLHLVL